MAWFRLPIKPDFNTTRVARTEQTTPVIDTHLNGYMQTLLENDQYNKDKADELNQSMIQMREELMTEINKKLDGTGIVTDYEEAISKTEEGTVPDTVIIRQLYLNFLNGCRAIAAAIRGGRDGNGTGGGTTAENETRLSTLTADIKTLAKNNYDDGVTDTLKGDATVSDVVRGKKFTSLVAGVNKDGELTDYRGSARQTVAPTGGTGTELLSLSNGAHDSVVVDRTAPYQQGMADAAGQEATFTNSFSSNTAGAASNLIVKCSKAGWTMLNNAVATIAAGINSTAIQTTKATGEQTLNIVPGVYNKIKVDQTNAYTAGSEDAKGIEATFTNSFSSNTAGAASNLIVKCSKAGWTILNKAVATIAAGVNSSAIATTSATGEQTLNIVPGVYNKIKVNQTNAYNAGSEAAKGIEATFTNSFSNSTAGAASNLIVKCSKAGWTILNNAVATIAAGVNSTAIATTSATGVQTLNIVPGVYNKIKVNQTNAYTAGQSSVIPYKIIVGHPQCSPDATTNEWEEDFEVPGVNLTVNNFFLVVTSIAGMGFLINGGSNAYGSLTVTYNTSTKKVKVTGLCTSSNGGSWAKLTGSTLYCIFTIPDKAFVTELPS